mgnify:CR=1 FL=1
MIIIIMTSIKLKILKYYYLQEDDPNIHTLRPPCKIRVSRSGCSGVQIPRSTTSFPTVDSTRDLIQRQNAYYQEELQIK